MHLWQRQEGTQIRALSVALRPSVARRGSVGPGMARRGSAGQRQGLFTAFLSDTGGVVMGLHPFDFDKLKKGMWIETEELELAATCKRSDQSFQLRVLGLKDAIESRTGILSRVEGQRLRLMTDSEALVWTIRQAGDAGRKLERNAARLSENIDAARLTDGEQAVHEHAQRVISAMAQSQRTERLKNQKLFALASSHPPVEDEDP